MTDLSAWVRLSRTRASAARLNQLLQRFGDPATLFAQSPEALARETTLPVEAARRLLDPSHAPAPGELGELESLGVRLVLRDNPEYPPLLGQIHDPPPLLYVRGQPLAVDRPAVAVVGTRGASSYGRAAAEYVGRELAAAGVVVVSGLAAGIDSHAHRGALAAGGPTWAVLGCGVDICYPGRNRALFEEVRSNGAAISEYPLGAAPDAWNFPRRNRIVSGLCLGVVVVEGSKGSGALLTAGCAVDQDREVFAVPGRVTDPHSWGPHGLIRDGARLVHTVDDILAELNLEGAAPSAPELPRPELTEEEASLYALLDGDPKAMDDVVLESGLPAGRVSAGLTMLELKGVARRLPGNCYARCRM